MAEQSKNETNNWNSTEMKKANDEWRLVEASSSIIYIADIRTRTCWRERVKTFYSFDFYIISLSLFVMSDRRSENSMTSHNFIHLRSILMLEEHSHSWWIFRAVLAILMTMYDRNWNFSNCKLIKLVLLPLPLPPLYDTLYPCFYTRYHGRICRRHCAESKSSKCPPKLFVPLPL